MSVARLGSTELIGDPGEMNEMITASWWLARVSRNVSIDLQQQKGWWLP